MSKGGTCAMGCLGILAGLLGLAVLCSGAGRLASGTCDSAGVDVLAGIVLLMLALALYAGAKQ